MQSLLWNKAYQPKVLIISLIFTIKRCCCEPHYINPNVNDRNANNARNNDSIAKNDNPKKVDDRNYRMGRRRTRMIVFICCCIASTFLFDQLGLNDVSWLAWHYGTHQVREGDEKSFFGHWTVRYKEHYWNIEHETVRDIPLIISFVIPLIMTRMDNHRLWQWWLWRWWWGRLCRWWL